MGDQKLIDKKFGIDFSACDKWHKCSQMHEDMNDVKYQLKNADKKRNEADTHRSRMDSTLDKIEGHLDVGNERFKWHERVGWGLGFLIFVLIGYMITMSIVSFNRDGEQNLKLMSIGKDVGHISKILGAD